MEPAIRQTCDKYLLFERLGHGAVGETFVARRADDPTAPLVCIKRLRQGFRKYGSDLERRLRAVESMQHEAKVVASLDHPNIPKVLDSGPYADDGWFIAFELVAGANLWDLVREEPPEADAVAYIGAEIAKALWCAHRADYLHRDIKPENILVGRDGRVKLVDFGLAKVGASLASTFSHVGTPRYYSPEQVRGAALTPQSDLYSLGLVLYELLSGEHLYSRHVGNGDDSTADGDEFPADVLQGESRFDFSDLEGPDELVFALKQCLSLDPAARPRSALALAKALEPKGRAFMSRLGRLADAGQQSRKELLERRSQRERERAQAAATIMDDDGQATKHRSRAKTVPGENLHWRPTRAMSAGELDALLADEDHDHERDRATVMADLGRMARRVMEAREAQIRDQQPTVIESHQRQVTATGPEVRTQALAPGPSLPVLVPPPPADSPPEGRARKRRWRAAAVAIAGTLTIATAVGLAAAGFLQPGPGAPNEPRAVAPAPQSEVATNAVSAAPAVPEAPPPAPEAAPTPLPTPAPEATVPPDARAEGKAAKANADKARPRKVRVTVIAEPYGVVYVDNKRLGNSPQTVTLRPGRHEFKGERGNGQVSRTEIIRQPQDVLINLYE